MKVDAKTYIEKVKRKEQEACQAASDAISQVRLLEEDKSRAVMEVEELTSQLHIAQGQASQGAGRALEWQVERDDALKRLEEVSQQLALARQEAAGSEATISMMKQAQVENARALERLQDADSRLRAMEEELAKSKEELNKVDTLPAFALLPAPANAVQRMCAAVLGAHAWGGLRTPARVPCNATVSRQRVRTRTCLRANVRARAEEWSFIAREGAGVGWGWGERQGPNPGASRTRVAKPET